MVLRLPRLGMEPFAEDLDHLSGRTRKCAVMADVRRQRVLDIGCSFGWYEQYALEAGCATIVGIDMNKAALAQARSRLGHRAGFIAASSLVLPFQSESFDLVTFFDVLEHLPRGTEDQAFQEISRVLRVGGLLAFSTPWAHPLSTILDPAWYFGHRHYRAEGITAKLGRCGFSVIALERGGGLGELFGMILFYLFKWVFRANMPFRSWFRARSDIEYERGGGFVSLLIVAQRTV